jgi:diguanylate cyclase (GGDEF)-like protein
MPTRTEAKMLSHVPENTRRRIGNAILVALALGLLAAMWGTVLRVRESMDEGRREVREAGQRMADALDHELDVHLSHLRAMKYLADRFLSGRARGIENPITRLVPVPERGGYQSVLPPEFGDRAHLGRFTGTGPVPAVDDPIADEMGMAVGLTPLMRAIKERSADVPWVQYASARQFMFIFPYQGSESFHFEPELLKRDYFARATPAANPQREVFWSRPYEDAAGQGRIVTVTQPIDRGDTFLGSVSIDFKVQSLRRFLDAVPIPNTHVHVVDREGQRIAQAWPHEDSPDPARHESIRLPLKSAPWQVELRIDDGELLAAALRGRAAHIAAVVVLGITFVFLLLLTRSHRQVRDLAITDALTGLYNRRHFDLVAEHQFELSKRKHLVVGLAMLDIDFFKKYNDHYGHQQGDVALKAVAGAIRQALRRGADQVFRVGGEEFAVLLALHDGDELEPLMRHVNQAIRDLQIPHVGNPSGHVTVSIGATVISEARWRSVDAAYQRADEALYQAKSGGRDTTVLLP